MQNRTLKTYLCGIGAYAACLVPAMLPIFQAPLDPVAAGRLGLAALLALVLTALALLTGFHARLGDRGASLTQGLLGLAICGGFYAFLAPVPEPQIVLMSLLWITIGLINLTPRQVLVLEGVYLTIYLNAFTSTMLSSGMPRHADAIYVLVVSLTLCAFMYLRARDYHHAHHEKADLHEMNAHQAEALEEAKTRIHAITMQDLDSIALKFPFFKEELRRCKERADASRTTFSTGLVEIDHLANITERYGETVVKQLLREVVERVTRVLGEMGLEDSADGAYHPLGKVGEGLYGVLLPRSNLKGARACAERLHKVVELQSIRTMAGMLNVTLTIGFAEYFPGETLDEIMQMVGVSLEAARVQNMEDLQAVQRPKQNLTPVKAATDAHDIRLLHYQEYESPLH
jgi:GGDEF domain-containing protein